ncbi:MAG TPA: hypothetical protein VKB38_11825 [Terracidiphilus sp.]|nr:hypothetical protein [Terracidiphilus sp.]
MSTLEALAVRAVKRWQRDREQLKSGKPMPYLARGFCSSERRQADARLVRVVAFERTFELMSPEDQALILAAHRDGSSAAAIAASEALPERSTRHHLRLARLKLADLLDRRHLL